MWLSIIAYMIRAGVKLGLVETEPESAQSRAYIRSHDALHWLRSQLADGQLTRVEETTCGYLKKGQAYTIRFQDGKLELSPPRKALRSVNPLTFDPEAVDEFELGPQGFVIFTYLNDQLKIKLQAGDDSTGEVGVAPVELQLRVSFA